MATDYTVIVTDHPDSAADEVIDDADFLVDPTVESLTEVLNNVLRGGRSPTNPVKRAQRYDWDTVVNQARTVYQCAIDES